MTFDQVLAALESRKGNGDWRLIAERSGIHYDTLARIARGSLENPGVRVVERIAKAIESLPPPAIPAEHGAA